MEDIDYDLLIGNIESSIKSSYEAREYNGKLVPNLANLGGKPGDIVKLERSGEYYGISVELLEESKPLLTDKFVIKILSILRREDYVTPLEMLGLTNLDQLQYILHEWMQIATINYDDSIPKPKKKYPIFDDYIAAVAHDPIDSKIKVVDVGYNQSTDNSVIPIDWIGRVFTSAYEMHKEMDKLETRLNKPPVTYAVIYSMIIQKQDTIIDSIANIKYKNIFYLDLTGSKMRSQLDTKSRPGYEYVQYGDTLIGFVLKDILEPKGKVEGGHSQVILREVGVLVSRLQKAIRRGRYGSKVLLETIDAINSSPNYNLPEHAFMRVSASKQLVWRLFISILEDCRPYQEINELGLLDLILLTLITQKVQEYKFTPKVLDLIKLTAILAQYNDERTDLYNWRALAASKDTPINPKSDFHTAISLAINNIIMMSGDNIMLRKLYSETLFFEPFMPPSELSESNWKKILANKKYILHDAKVYEDIILSSYDQHSKPNIILYYQACIPVSLTTKEISGYIWDVSSSYNVRSGKSHPPIDKVLRTIQKCYYLEAKSAKKIINPPSSSRTIEGVLSSYKKTKPSKYVSRISFLALFGKKYRFQGKEIILAGTSSEPARVKIKNEWVYSNNLTLLNGYPRRTITLTNIDPPFGYKWTKAKVVTEIIGGKPTIDGKHGPWFDGSSVISSIKPIVSQAVDSKTQKFIMQIFSGLDIDFETLLLFRRKSLPNLVNWVPKKADVKKFDSNLVILAYTKIFNQFNNIITIGPVSRGGSKMQNSINYQLEGKLWAVFNLLTFMYPSTLKPNGSLNFYIAKGTAGYVHLVETLESIIFKHTNITGPVPKIKTPLWDHQLDSSNRILAGFREGCHGFGESSDVGSGKTLTSLNIAVELIKINSDVHSGILVLLPGNKLIKTWEEELAKHTEGFDIIFQQNTSSVGTIKRNTIVVTTMARNRDHPINHKWLLVIIDECLSVQNKNSLWTENAWVQSLMSAHLVMMSATFFRTRFDKLYYMLKMLSTGLPERREYLETILLESIVSQVSSVTRKWISNFNYFELRKPSREKYELIENTNLSTEAKFSKLTSFLISDPMVNSFVTTDLGLLIKRLEKKGHRCLIYARAKPEAEMWSRGLKIPIYPKKGLHTIVTVHEGTYGLNDLIIYDCIVSRPPQPDKLPQMKGRLNRPGQQSQTLRIEYFVIKDTVEMGLILRLNIASSFLQKYIMPLSKFYDISVNYQKYLDEEVVAEEESTE